jgi:2-polyprenyl-6-methoxyphenol hydroxylase-like FAD-dependent oxidoreductase
MFDLIVIGGGSGGTGAAITAGRAGLRVLWVEAEARLGGTGVNAFVNVWQPAYTRSALAREIAERLIATGGACYNAACTDTPTGRPIYRQAEVICYEQTLTRWQDRANGLISPGVVYSPHAMDSLLRELAAEVGVTLWDGTVCLDVRSAGHRVTAVELFGPRGRAWVEAGAVVDATADIAVARRAGCAWAIDREARAAHDEPSAPETPEFKLNGPTLCFTIAPGPDRVALPAEGYGHDSDWAHIGQLPNGDYYVNMVFQLPGEEAHMLGAEATRERLLGNIARRWPRVQAAYGLTGYGITALAPRTGYREGPRLVGRYVLTETDFRRGNYGAHHPDCIAFTDHALDRHSPDGGCIEAENGPMGIPFRCLQPQEYDNLLVASRGASFSSLTASAARLQRNMIELGEAAARAVAMGTS